MTSALRWWLFSAVTLIGVVWYVLTPYVIRYRLTLTVDVGGVPVTGSGVVETRWQNNFDIAGRPWRAWWRGEAITVDLGSRGKMFVLLTGDPFRSDSEQEPLHLLSETYFGSSVGGTTGVMLREIRDNHAPRQIMFAHLPLLIRFRDINEPHTFERVDPDNLAASFGEKVRLTGAVIESTNEPVTIGIERLLKWLPNYCGSNRYPGFYPKGPLAVEGSLGCGAFLTR